MANNGLVFGGLVVIACTVATLVYMIVTSGNSPTDPALQYVPKHDMMPMEVDSTTAELGDKVASLEASVSKSLATILSRLDGLSNGLVSTDSVASAVVGPADSHQTQPSNTDPDIVPVQRGEPSRVKKDAFASYKNPASVTAQLTKATSHICTGRDFTKAKIPNSDQHPSCYFKHLCIAPGKGEPPREYRTRGYFDWYYLYDNVPPPDSVNFTLGTGPHMVDSKLLVAPKAVNIGDFVKEFPEVRIEPTLTHIFYEYNGENFGHMLTDVMMPIYSILAGFNQLDYDVQLVRYQMTHDLGYSCDFQRNPGWGNEGWIPDRIVNPRADKVCKKFYEMFTPSITSRPIVLMNQLFNKTTTPVCFKDLLVGTPMLSDDCMEGNHGRDLHLWSNCMTGRMEQMWNFRSYLKKNLGVPEIPPKKHHIVIWDRPDGRRKLHNLQGLGSFLKGKFNVKVTIVDWSKISLQEQLALIGETTVHITGPGGGSFIGMFLPRGATTIRLYSAEFGMEFHFFNYLGYIHADYRQAPRGEIDKENVANLVEIAMHRYNDFKDFGHMNRTKG